MNRALLHISLLCIAGVAALGQAKPTTKHVPLAGRETAALGGIWHTSIEAAGAKAADLAAKPPAEAKATEFDLIRQQAGAPIWLWRTEAAPSRWHDRNVRLRLYDVPAALEAWVNGEKVGEAEKPLALITFDITKRVKVDSPLLIALRLPALADGPPMKTPELIISDEAHISDVVVDAQPSGWLNVTVMLFNTSDKTGDAELTVDVATEAEPAKKVGSTYRTLVISPGANRMDIMLRIRRPRTPPPGGPPTYVLTAALRQAKDVLDNESVKFKLPAG